MLKIVFCILRVSLLFSTITIYELNLNIYMFKTNRNLKYISKKLNYDPKCMNNVIYKHIFMKNTEIKKFKCINSKHYFYTIKYYQYIYIYKIIYLNKNNLITFV